MLKDVLFSDLKYGEEFQLTIGTNHNLKKVGDEMASWECFGKITNLPMGTHTCVKVDRVSPVSAPKRKQIKINDLQSYKRFYLTETGEQEYYWNNRSQHPDLVTGKNSFILRDKAHNTVGWLPSETMVWVAQKTFLDVAVGKQFKYNGSTWIRVGGDINYAVSMDYKVLQRFMDGEIVEMV